MKDRKDLETLCFLREQSSFEDDYRDSFGYKVFDKGNRFYVTFEAVLQSFAVMNRNHRMYDAQNVWNCIQTDEQIQTLLKNNSWVGEADHPAAEIQGEELTMQRISTPDVRKSSHYIRKPRLEGNLLLGTIQTDSGTDDGMNMAIKIVDGKIVPCFSARVLGALSHRGSQPIVNVRKLITYDWVLYPSHREAQAKISQPLQESVQQAEDFVGTIIFLPELARMASAGSKDAQFICEAFDLSADDLIGVTETGNSVVIQENSNLYVAPLSSDIVRKQTQNSLRDWLNS